jgi:AAHS family benzoate transporter-like MFS transporter
VLNGGAVVAALVASRLADRFGPKMVVVGSFLLGAVSLALLTIEAPLALLLLFVAVVGAGTSGTQILICGFVASYRANVRGAGVAWCAGFGRLGGVAGPLVGGLLVAAGLQLEAIFYVLTGMAAFGALLTLLVPVARRAPAARPVPWSPRSHRSRPGAEPRSRVLGHPFRQGGEPPCTTGSSSRSMRTPRRGTPPRSGAPSRSAS